MTDLLEMVPPEPLSRFLGVQHSLTQHGFSKRGNAVHRLVVCQSEYAKSIVDLYNEAIKFPSNKKLRHVATPMDDDSLASVINPTEPGTLEEYAARFTGKLLYLCRMSRPDLQTAICRLSRFLHCWNRYAELLLHRIMQYLEHYLCRRRPCR